ncbi:MAG TPA: MFS transporter [Caulobacteraceae bacterium]|nr:MFS transporter [Caulobacteraceae bacterium]
MVAGAIAAPGRRQFGWSVVALMGLSVFINYVDRGNLATAAPLIKDQLRLSATQIGVLIAAFSWTYTPSMFLAGWLCERINPYRTLALGLLVWSLATAATGLAPGFAALIVLRLVLGIGESAAFPASSALIGGHLEPARLGRANGMIGLGLSLGPAFGTFAGGLLIASLGWRPVFIVFGLGSVLWLWPWLARTRALWVDADAPGRPAAPSYVAILSHREAWGAAIGHFAANYLFYFILSWMPLYLVKARGYSEGQMAEIGGAIYLAYAASIAVAGWLTDRAIAGGASINGTRKTAAIACHIVAPAGLMISAFGDHTWAVAGLFIAAVGSGLNTAGIYAIAQTLAGPRASGKWVSFQNAAGNVAGMIGPVITGVVVDATGQFLWAFVITAAVGLTGAIGWGVVIRRVAPLKWAT